ncbi:MAG: InlB B-repeat-containing protein [Clostridia bacterium]|nr:InlB B-repeat-containing protein [Clostridia bacterium]
MKRMKRLAAFLLLAVMLANTIPFYAFAAGGEMTLTVSTVSGTPGEEVTVTVDVSDNPGIASLVFDVNYDSMLTLVDVQFSEAFGNLVTTPEPYTNPQTITLISPFADTSANGTLATLTFAISESAADEYEAEVSITCKDNEIVNANKELVPTKAVNGKVCVFRGIPGDVNGDKAVNTKDAVLLFRYVAGWDVTVDPLAVDCNGDGIVDTWDAIELFRYTADWPDIKLYYATMCAHDLEYVEANEATCTEDGNVAHWHCSACNGNYSDAKGKEVLNAVIVDAIGHDMQYNAEKAPTCTESGNVEYWHCANCELNFADEDGDTVIGVTSISETGHDLTKFSEQSATCTESGNVTYWFCETCEKNFKDEDATEEIGDVTVSASGHKLSFVEAKEATHISDGNVAYWYCTACKCCFTDDSASTEIADVVIPATGHGEMLEHVEAKESTVYEKGNEEYWYCPVCDKYYSDAEAENELVGGKPERELIASYSITFVDDKHWHDGKNYYKILVSVEEDYSIGADHNPTQVLGYGFDGWYTEEGVKKTFISAAPVGTNIILIAKWYAISYEIEYKNDADNANPDTYTIEDSFRLTDPDWQGLRFSHWTDENGEVVTQINKGTTGKIELEAHWIYDRNFAVESDNKAPVIIIKPNEYISTKKYENFPEGIPNSKELFYIVYDLGTICNVKLDTIYELPKYDGLTIYSHTHKKDVTTTASTATTINRIITSSVVNSFGFTTLQSYSTEFGISEGLTMNFCPEINVFDCGAKIGEYQYDAGISQISTNTYSTEKYEGQEFGKDISEELSCTISYDTSVTEEQGDEVTLSPEISPAGFYSLVWAANFEVYAIVTYDPYTEEYGINFYSSPIKTFPTIFYELAPEDSSGVDIKTQNILDYDVPMLYIPDQSTGDSSSYVKSIIDSCYYIDYDANGGEGEKMPISLGLADGEATLIPNTYTKEGYTFDKWLYTKDTEFGYFGDGDTISNPFVAGVTIRLKALWKPNSYSVNYDPNGGEGEMVASSFVYDEENPLAKNSFTKVGYTFAGWSRNPSDSIPEFTDEEKVMNLSSEVNGIVTLYAVWTPNNYTVNYDANGGSGKIDSQTFTYDVKSALPTAGFSKSGYGLIGWSTDPDAIVPQYLIGEKVTNLASEGTVTLYAVWMINYYYAQWNVDNGHTVKDDDTGWSYAKLSIRDVLDLNTLNKYFKRVKIEYSFHIQEIDDGYQSFHVILAPEDCNTTYVTFDGGSIKLARDSYISIYSNGNIETVSGSVGSRDYKDSSDKSIGDLVNKPYMMLAFGAHGKYSDDWVVSNIKVSFTFYN